MTKGRPFIYGMKLYKRRISPVKWIHSSSLFHSDFHSPTIAGLQFPHISHEIESTSYSSISFPILASRSGLSYYILWGREVVLKRSSIKYSVETIKLHSQRG